MRAFGHGIFKGEIEAAIKMVDEVVWRVDGGNGGEDFGDDGLTIKVEGVIRDTLD